MLNLSMVLEDSARSYPDHVALVSGEREMTYAAVDAEANRVAGLLVERGVEPGDRIALACPNLMEYPIVYYGALKAGAVVVPLNVTLRSQEIAYHLADSGAKAFFCFEGSAALPVGAEGRTAFDQVDSCRDFFVISAAPGAGTLVTALAGRSPVFETVLRRETDPVMILYTSGTSGRPKGALLSHTNLLFNVVAADMLLGNAPRRDTHLVTLPLFHSFATTIHLNTGFASASTLVLLPRFDPAAVADILMTRGITFFAGVPTMYWALLNVPAERLDAAAVGRLRVAVSAGSALPVTIIEEFTKRFGVTILESYGLSETSPAATITRPGNPPRPGSIGVPIWGVDLKLVDEDGATVEGPDRVGEILIRGHNVMLGYHERPEETAQALRGGWMHTGDLGRRDADGWYYVVDRLTDMIIRGGANVYPREVEEMLMEHEAVSLAAVIGVPDPALGEEVKAVIVRGPGHLVTEDELVAWARQRMAGYKYPRSVEFVAEIPLTATGKPLKRALR
ncbi:long-chain-fatty-acid--CoA ligase [Actinoplanes derwentensis]|uniref:Long-chain acyl-CoA synthetase n=1 Tax=Actinoplanes derwentensis TaxID=113562 RepID=A0A1H1X0U5_9ACTN|nr:long-chain fatty acid--CoA ligase [Actinoplanes derwentensis]GID85756.1 long-chain-fatty-acid--CoA ligase [Actinoplanes derwentensis]SDT02977.1 long-chain acyl-CoA synthetase [Actinoplanes derwentensis]